MISKKIVFVAAKRTAFGAFGKSLADLSATDLAVHASQAAIAQSKLPTDKIDHVTFGIVIQSSSDAAYLARHVGLRVGTRINTPALTLNRLCGSGFEAVVDGARRIQLGEAKYVLTGGTENMSQSPYVLRKARFGYRMGHGQLEDSLVEGLYDSYPKIAMSGTAENLARKYSISRQECDAFAQRSQELASQAQSKGLFKEEIAPISLKTKKQEIQFDKDEHVRPESTLESLAKLKPVFDKEGVITAGNASGICDGAAALVLCTEETAKNDGLSILGELVAHAVVGCEPSLMGLGPVGASQQALQKADLKFSDLKAIEINEAFSSQALAVQKELGFDMKLFNQQGGAIALGHPLGASGARLTAHLLYQLRNLGGGFGLASACIGGGQGITLILKV